MSQSKKLPKEVALTLKCIQCQQYLSVPPISINASGHHCGRCTGLAVQNHESYFLSTAYEALARTTRFPCQYDSFGCTEFLEFDETATHERLCKFKAVKCPAVGCDVRIQLCYVSSHYKKYHNELITNPLQFCVSANEDTSKNELVTLNSNTYILATCTSSKEKKVWLGLRNFDAALASEETFYQLEVKRKNSNALVLNQERITMYNPETNFVKADMMSLDFKKIRSVLKGEDITFSIKLTNLAQVTNVNNSILEELECIVCQEYMIPPIYICKTGHSLCSECKNKVELCPTCRGQFEGARNFALEKLCQKAEYPCRNQLKGCNFIGGADQIAIHLLGCALGKMILCPLEKQEKCKWSGLSHNIYLHCMKTHPLSIATDPETIFYRNVKQKTVQECHVMSYDGNTFQVHRRHHDNKGPSLWAVLHFELSPSEKPKYRFILNFIDPTGTGQTLTIGYLCSSAQKNNDPMGGNSIKLPHDLLIPFIDKRNVMGYSILIKRVESTTLVAI